MKHELIALFLVLLSSSMVAAVRFEPCVDGKKYSELGGSLCTKIQVPLSYQKSGANDSKVSLFIRKLPVANADGDVWFLAGGPGESGASFYPFLRYLKTIFPKKNLIFPDHRGTGYSDRMCPTQENVDSPGGLQLVGSEWPACFAFLNKNAMRTKQFTITNSARDLDKLIAQISGRRKTFLYGVSYGTELALRTLLVSNHNFKGIILDSLVPANNDARYDLSRRSMVTNDIGLQLLDWCRSDKKCKGRLSNRSNQTILTSLSNNSQLDKLVPGGNFKHFLGGLLDDRELRAEIPKLLIDSVNGKEQVKTRVEKINNIYAQKMAKFIRFEQAIVSIPLVSLISSSENNLRPKLSKEAIEQEERQLIFTSPLARHLISPGMPLYAKDGFHNRIAKTKAKLLVLHGTLDSKTHYIGAKSHIELLKDAENSVGLVTVQRAPHSILFLENSCVKDAIRMLVKSKKVVDGNCDPNLPID